jgi:hypothetical protein
MASTFVNFQPSSSAPFSFQPTLAGVQYAVTVPYNEFGQGYYINITDLLGNPILFRSLVSSGPVLQADFSWAGGIAMATALTPHNVPIGNVVNIRIALTNTGFDGSYQALSVSSTALTYSLLADPLQSGTVTGQINFDLNLVGGYNMGTLLYHDDTQQFEYF